MPDATVQTFIDDFMTSADAAAARGELGLGTLATQNNITSNQLVNDFGSGGKIVSAPPGLSGILYLSVGSSLTSAGSTLDVASSGVTNAMLAGSIDLTTKVTGTLPVANGGTGVTALSSLNAADLGSGGATTDYVLTADGSGGAAWAASAASGGDVSDGDTLSLGLTFPNTGLKVLESGSGSTLQLSTDTDLTADRVLTLATGDANRTLTFSANATVGGTNSGDVTLAGSLDYLTISGQQITRNAIDLTTDVTGTLPAANGGTGQTSLGAVDAADFGSGASTDGYVLTADGVGGAAWEAVAGGGTVTSVAVTGSDGIEVDSGSPITGAGTIALGINKATALSHLNVEDGADVTDATNVQAAGALMDSELTSLSGVKTLTVPDNTTVSSFGASLVDDADAAAARTTLDVDQAGTDNSTDVTLAGSLDYLTISGQEITRNAIDLATDVTGTLPVANGGTGQTSLASVDAADLGAGASADGQVLMSDGSAGAAWEALPCEIGVACSDESTALTTGTAKVTFRMPYAMTLTAVRASVTTAPTGSTLIVDINEAGSSVLSTKLSIDATEKTSTTAATAAVISDSALADDAEITIDIDQIGSTVAGAGLKVWLIGKRA